MRWLIIFIVFIGLIGCTPVKTDVKDLNGEIRQYGIDAEIPEIDGLVPIYVHVHFPLVDGNGNSIGDHSALVITYSEKKGANVGIPDEEKETADRKILYGPYDGEKVMDMTISNAENHLEGAEDLSMSDGTKIEFKQSNDRVLFVFNREDLSYFIEGRFTDRYTLKKYMDIVEHLAMSLREETTSDSAFV